MRSDVARSSDVKQLVVMKQTRLVLDEALLTEAMRLSGEKTHSSTGMRALADFVRRSGPRRILELRGSGAWEGSLATMRGDRGRRTKRAP